MECSIDNCTSNAVARTYCHKHWHRWKKFGDPLQGKSARPYLRGVTTAERFWNDVAVTTNPDDCWEWKWRTNEKGYGATTYERRPVKAHRLAWFVTYGKWPEPACLHSCDNPPCCNPKHLREGASQDNHDDMVARKRHLFGDRATCRKLTAEQVIKIKQDIIQGVKCPDIARSYKVERSTIERIKYGKSWNWLEPTGDLRPLIRIAETERYGR